MLTVFNPARPCSGEKQVGASEHFGSVVIAQKDQKSSG
jgi:hypothetical protein